MRVSRNHSKVLYRVPPSERWAEGDDQWCNRTVPPRLQKLPSEWLRGMAVGGPILQKQRRLRTHWCVPVLRKLSISPLDTDTSITR